jgi:hypothetical protein
MVAGVAVGLTVADVDIARQAALAGSTQHVAMLGNRWA